MEKMGNGRGGCREKGGRGGWVVLDFKKVCFFFFLKRVKIGKIGCKTKGRVEGNVMMQVLEGLLRLVLS